MLVAYRHRPGARHCWALISDVPAATAGDRVVVWSHDVIT